MTIESIQNTMKEYCDRNTVGYLIALTVMSLFMTSDFFTGLLLVGGVVVDITFRLFFKDWYFHRQTYRILKTLVFSTLVFLLLLQSKSIHVMFIYGLPFAFGFGWVILDALSSRYTNTIDEKGSVAGVADVSDVIANVIVTNRIVRTLETTERALSISEIATVCQLEECRVESAIAMLEQQEILVRNHESVILEETQLPVSIFMIFLQSTLKRILQPFRLLLHSALPNRRKQRS